MKTHFWVFLVVLIVLINLPGSSAWRRRRRRRCPRRDCALTNWFTVGTCSRTCGGGTVLQRNNVRQNPSCGGRACPPYNSAQRRRYASCNTQCCRVNCAWSWNAWGPCPGCGLSRQTRTMRILRNPLCGGTACPSKRSETRSCATGMKCPTTL